MPASHRGLYHLHRRRQKSKQPKQSRAHFKLRKYIDNWTYVIAVVVPLMTIPQAAKIWLYKSANDVSLVTWVAFLVSAFTWLTYSAIHKDKPLIINSVLWVLLETLVIIGTIVYG